MPHTTVIAIDAMGGDNGPSIVVPGALQAVQEYNIKVLLVGQTEQIEAEIHKANFPSRLEHLIEIIHSDEVAEMHEKPSDILRKKKNASIQIACRLVRDGKAHGLVSAGHSGASVACGMFIVGRIPHLDRPALASVLPTEKKPVILLDVGANVDCKPHHLFQFGLMADAFAKDILQCEKPRVGLLSIGEEEGKGNSQVNDSAELFRMAKNINFVGNVEGRALFRGDIDVVVCDGFVGNVALKLSEGLGSSLTRILKRELLASAISKVGTLLAKPAFKRFAQIIDYAEYGGAPLLGLQNIVIVCHGASNCKAIKNAIGMATTFVTKKTNEKLIAAVNLNEELTRFGKTL